MVILKINIYSSIFRAEFFAGNHLFNTISRLFSHNQSPINNQNNNNCQQLHNVVQAGVARGGTL